MFRLLLICGLVFVCTSSLFGEVIHSNNRLFYLQQPDKKNIEKCYLPIGNGAFGAMVRGGTNEEIFNLNLDSLWTGDVNETGAYQRLGFLRVNFPDIESSSKSYKRTLNIETAVHTVEFVSGKGKQLRKYFCSYPDKVMVLSFFSEKAQSVEIILEDDTSLTSYKPVTNAEKITHEVIRRRKKRVVTEYKSRIFSVVKAKGKKIILQGKLANGLKFSAQLQVHLKNGTVKVEGNRLFLKNTNEFSILFSTESDYAMSLDKNWKKLALPEVIVAERINKASALTVSELEKRHIADYQSLYNKMFLHLGETPDKFTAMPTDRRLSAFGKEFSSSGRVLDPGLEELIANYGRYLIISCSRPGTMPANLQGLWSWKNSPNWRCDYHSNINVQMNYWLTEPAGLGDCFLPFSDYIMAMRDIQLIKTPKLVKHPNGKTADRGWAVKTENGIFGGFSFVWNFPGAAWYALHLWEHYAFTEDKKFLKEKVYPVLKETCHFWEDRLLKRKDGTFVVPHGWSPEHGPKEDGVTYDQEIVYDLFTNYIEASKELGVDADYRKKVADMRSHLLPLKIGRWGQLQEWETDRDNPKDSHRHVSHLFGLHPGRQISPFINKDIFDAAKVSLNGRGDGGTGWSKAWKISFWARFHDGNRANKLIAEQITHNFYKNLFDFHAPFQIDGNFGNTAGVLEMLLQSHIRSGKISSKVNSPWIIELLPALPDVWSIGEVRGIRSRGNITVNMKWKNGILELAELFGEPGKKLVVAYNKKIRNFIIPSSGVLKLTSKNF